MLKCKCFINLFFSSKSEKEREGEREKHRSVVLKKIIGKRAVNICADHYRVRFRDPYRIEGHAPIHHPAARSTIRARANRTKKRDCVPRNAKRCNEAAARGRPLYRWQLRRHALCIFALRAAACSVPYNTTRSSHWKRDGVVTNPERTEIASPLPRQYLTALNNKCTCSSPTHADALASLETRGYRVLLLSRTRFYMPKRNVSMKVSLEIKLKDY